MDILDEIEIGEDAAGLLLKASLGVMNWNRREKTVILFLDIDTYKNEDGAYGAKITGNVLLDKKGKYNKYELSMIATNDTLVDSATGGLSNEETLSTVGEYDFLNSYFNNPVMLKQVIKSKIQAAATRGQLK